MPQTGDSLPARPAAAIAIVPARAGSKGVPGKNLRQVGGLSLVARAIAVALRVDGIDEVVVSTDGEDIALEAKRHGAGVHWRPSHLATDTVPVIDAVRHLRDQLRAAGNPPRYGVLLEPTSPLRSVDDVARCLAAVRAGADSAATFTEAAVHPHRAFVIDQTGAAPFVAGAVPWRPRQELQPPAYQLSGGAYAFDFAALPDEGLSFLFGRVAPVVVPRARSVDVDNEVDLLVVEAMLAAPGADPGGS